MSKLSSMISTIVASSPIILLFHISVLPSSASFTTRIQGYLKRLTIWLLDWLLSAASR